MNYFGKTAAFIFMSIALIGLASFQFFVEHPSFEAPVQERIGTAIPTPVASFGTSLADKITSSDTSMTLVSTSTDDGTSLTVGTFYGFVIDANTADEEYVVGTVSSSRRIVSMSRGVSVNTGNTEISALKKSHRRGASVKIADAPVLLVLARILNGQESLPNGLHYATSVTTSSLLANTSSLVSTQLLIDTAITGGVNGSEGTQGFFEAATNAETAAGTAIGGTGALLVPQNKYFNATSSATTTVPVTNILGKLSQGFWNLTESFTWGAAHIFNSLVTFNGGATFATLPTIPTSTPTSSAQVVSKGVLDAATDYVLVTSSSVSAVTSTTFSGLNPSSTYMIEYRLVQNTASGTLTMVVNGDTGNNYFYAQQTAESDASAGAAGSAAAANVPLTLGAEKLLNAQGNSGRIWFQRETDDMHAQMKIDTTYFRPGPVLISLDMSAYYSGASNLSSIRFNTSAGTYTGVFYIYVRI